MVVSPFWTTVAIVASVVTLITGICFLLDKLLGLRKWIQNRRLLPKKAQGEPSPYLFLVYYGLYGAESIILNEALKTRKNISTKPP